MTEQQPSAPHHSDDDQDGAVVRVDQTDARSLLPFIAAGALAVIALVAIVIGGLVSPAEKNVTTADKVAAAIRNYAEGVNSAHTLAPPGAVCDGFDADRSPLADQGGVGKTAEVTNVEGPVVEGDRAHATVTTKVDGTENSRPWQLRRTGGESGKWLVCN